ncbi:MAG: hypothetical protein AB7P03_12555 [Kofleriaceae bacterium]
MASSTDPLARYVSARALHDAVARYLDGYRTREQRRTIAAEHARRAQTVLQIADQTRGDYEDYRGVAMHELVRTVAIDPTNTESVAALTEILNDVPTTTPLEVERSLAEDDERLIASGARYLALAGLMWAPFIPVVLYMGVRNWFQLLWVLAPMTLAVGLATVAYRRRHIPPAMQLAVIALNVVACAGTTRMFGPLVVTPTLLAAFAIVIQTHPAAMFRNATLLLSCLGVAAPALLELVTSTAYSFDAGQMIISPQMHELPPTLTILLMTIASLGMIITPCIVVSRLRTSLTAAQRQVRVQAWHFQRLGHRLIDVKQAPHD